MAPCPASFDLIDPVIFEIGPFALRWYALAYIAGFFLGLFYVLKLIARPRLWTTHASPKAAPMDRAYVEELMLWVMVGVIVGGRFGYVLFYQTSALWERPLWVITGITEGGMSFHGGLIGVMLAMIITARLWKIPLLNVSDAVAAATPIGLLLGRLANFINGELWGRPAPDLPWAMRFADDPLCALRHPSQLYEAFLEGAVLLALIAFLIWRFRALSRPGLVTGVFLAGYGVFRAFVEIFREPDRHMPEALQGYVTMGMLLCVPMIAAGAYLIWRSLKAPPASVPGEVRPERKKSRSKAG
ncbi:prolipoprotein diacylglyceryl transferase [Glycocaulis alkaliphilus]|uniref:Phosphatidylglycerol--prolipoprotein diacylglyceryl transferase n=1 Tax=Glycocaulis alkaliphilus TaxID=1434191 RepID=A0A3T0E6Z1_9PROT|nr:prolipoprotein diacylglyceryl transferase [Glycocaulis alkaliphilus]AZU02987.1 prolipoprotein diacylglyceryl transferase [Glycocaulis alkaliphilus]GGB70105.1 prolipoprotein diacylglyceryl transferase [Glycocaulis alkaliphilus]